MRASAWRSSRSAFGGHGAGVCANVVAATSVSKTNMRFIIRAWYIWSAATPVAALVRRKSGDWRRRTPDSFCRADGVSQDLRRRSEPLALVVRHLRLDHIDGAVAIDNRGQRVRHARAFLHARDREHAPVAAEHPLQ